MDRWIILFEIEPALMPVLERALDGSMDHLV